MKMHDGVSRAFSVQQTFAVPNPKTGISAPLQSDISFDLGMVVRLDFRPRRSDQQEGAIGVGKGRDTDQPPGP